jgi:hypothetical protein
LWMALDDDHDDDDDDVGGVGASQTSSESLP